MNRRSFFKMAVGAVTAVVAAPVLKLTKALRPSSVKTALGYNFYDLQAASLEAQMQAEFDKSCQEQAGSPAGYPVRGLVYVDNAPVSAAWITTRWVPVHRSFPEGMA